MNKTFRISTVVIFLSVIAFYGCSYRPTEQIERAEKAMAQAQEQHADEFSPNEWNSGMEAWNKAQEALDQERYSQASPYLLKTMEQFNRARDIAKGKREALLREIQGLQTTIDIRYKGVKISMEEAKLSSKVKKELEASCSEIDEAIIKIANLVDEGEYNQASFLAQTTMRKVYEAEQLLPGSRKKSQ